MRTDPQARETRAFKFLTILYFMLLWFELLSTEPKMYIIDPERIAEGMFIVLSRESASMNNTTLRRVARVTHIDRNADLDSMDVRITYEAMIMEPKRPECSCVDKRRHRINRTTLEQIDTDQYGEARAGFTQPEFPRLIKLKRDDFWKMQEFPDAS